MGVRGSVFRLVFMITPPPIHTATTPTVTLFMPLARHIRRYFRCLYTCRDLWKLVSGLVQASYVHSLAMMLEGPFGAVWS